MADAIRDGNHVPVALGVSSTSSTTTLPLKINSTNGGLIVDPSGDAWEAMSGQILSGTINGLATGETLFYTVPAGKKFIGTFAYFEIVSVTNFAAAPSVSIGKTVVSQSIMETTALSGLGGDGTALMLKIKSNTIAAVGEPGDEIYISVDTAATADVYTFRVRLFGTLVDA